jgi:hypothetical protein
MLQRAPPFYLQQKQLLLFANVCYPRIRVPRLMLRSVSELFDALARLQPVGVNEKGTKTNSLMESFYRTSVR